MQTPDASLAERRAATRRREEDANTQLATSYKATGPAEWCDGAAAAMPCTKADSSLIRLSPGSHLAPARHTPAPPQHTQSACHRILYICAHAHATLWARARACVCIYVCMCVCARARARVHIHTYMHTHGQLWPTGSVGAGHRVSRPRGTGSVGDSAGEGRQTAGWTAARASSSGARGGPSALEEGRRPEGGAAFNHALSYHPRQSIKPSARRRERPAPHVHKRPACHWHSTRPDPAFLAARTAAQTRDTTWTKEESKHGLRERSAARCWCWYERRWTRRTLTDLPAARMRRACGRSHSGTTCWLCWLPFLDHTPRHKAVSCAFKAVSRALGDQGTRRGKASGSRDRGKREQRPWTPCIPLCPPVSPLSPPVAQAGAQTHANARIMIAFGR